MTYQQYICSLKRFIYCHSISHWKEWCTAGIKLGPPYQSCVTLWLNTPSYNWQTRNSWEKQRRLLFLELLAHITIGNRKGTMLTNLRMIGSCFIVIHFLFQGKWPNHSHLSDHYCRQCSDASAAMQEGSDARQAITLSINSPVV